MCGSSVEGSFPNLYVLPVHKDAWVADLLVKGRGNPGNWLSRFRRSFQDWGLTFIGFAFYFFAASPPLYY